jgi:hypothetical protein
VVKGDLIELIDSDRIGFQLIKGQGLQWLTLVRWLLELFGFILLLAGFEVDFQTCTAILASADIADQGLRSLCGLLHLDLALVRIHLAEATCSDRRLNFRNRFL